ncbi:MAG: hypothetical protein MRJ65_12015 [Candidatus Brocadiaceae bacterium]|nr:hypothetical protein [Candidatus Brocadiaceae bacterium]
MKQVQGLKDVRIRGIEREKQKLEQRVKKLKKEKDVKNVKAQVERLKQRLRCDCQLYLYTSAPLDVAEARRQLDAEVERIKLLGLKEKLKRVKQAQQKLEKGKKDQYAMPLGINPVTPEHEKMVLLATERKMIVYCPLDIDTPKPVEKSIDEIEFFSDMPIEQEKDLIVRDLLK